MADALASQLNNTSLGYVGLWCSIGIARFQCTHGCLVLGEQMRMQNGKNKSMHLSKMEGHKQRFVLSYLRLLLCQI